MQEHQFLICKREVTRLSASEDYCGKKKDNKGKLKKGENIPTKSSFLTIRLERHRRTDQVTCSPMKYCYLLTYLETNNNIIS